MCTMEVKPAPIGLRIKHVLRIVLAVVFTFFCKLYYGDETKKIPPIEDEVLKLPAIEVARRIRNKETTSVQVLETCIRRIKNINSALNCFVEDRFELAMKEANEADDLIRSGKITSEQLEKEKPYLGVPFTTKDCIGVKGLHQTSGVVLRKNFICEEDAPVIKLLRDKGAIIIGLTNVPELCMWWETHNHIHGRTNNPYNTNRIVGGSSGGEGCLQAAAGSIFGVGSDIGGSIRMPAYFNGIFGHKPSRNVVSNAGEFPPASTDVHDGMLGTGPMTRHAIDLKPLLKIMAGENSDKLNLDQKVDLKNIKINYQFDINAFLTDPVDKEIIDAMKNVLEHFKVKHGLNAVEHKIQELEKSLPLWFATMTSPKTFGEFIMKESGKYQVIKEIFKNFIGCSGNTLIGLFTSLADDEGLTIGDERYNMYAKKREHLIKHFKDMLGENGVFLFPTHPTAAPYHNEPLARPLNFGYTAIINCLGLPATNVPLGLNRDGLPIGLQVIANHDNDRLCLAVAEELDKAFGGWVEPQKSRI